MIGTRPENRRSSVGGLGEILEGLGPAYEYLIGDYYAEIEPRKEWGTLEGLKDGWHLEIMPGDEEHYEEEEVEGDEVSMFQLYFDGAAPSWDITMFGTTIDEPGQIAF